MGTASGHRGGRASLCPAAWATARLLGRAPHAKRGCGAGGVLQGGLPQGGLPVLSLAGREAVALQAASAPSLPYFTCFARRGWGGKRALVPLPCWKGSRWISRLLLLLLCRISPADSCHTPRGAQESRGGAQSFLTAALLPPCSLLCGIQPQGCAASPVPPGLCCAPLPSPLPPASPLPMLC